MLITIASSETSRSCATRVNVSQSNRHLRTPGSFRATPIDPLQQHRQLCRRQHGRALLRPRPYEPTSVQALGEQAQPVAVPPQDLHQIAAPPTEAKQVARKRVFIENRLHQRRQTVEPFTQV